MNLRIVHAIVLLLCLAGGVYYMSVDKESQGMVVVLLGILYFLGVPRLFENE